MLYASLEKTFVTFLCILFYTLKQNFILYFYFSVIICLSSLITPTHILHLKIILQILSLFLPCFTTYMYIFCLNVLLKCTLNVSTLSLTKIPALRSLDSDTQKQTSISNSKDKPRQLVN